MRIALLTEGGFPAARGEFAPWCDRLLRGLEQHDFEAYALTRDRDAAEASRCEPPANLARVRTAPLWGEPPGSATGVLGGRSGLGGRRERRRFVRHYGELVGAVCTAAPGAGDELADRFASGLYGLAELAREGGSVRLPLALRAEPALRVLESACQASGSWSAARSMTLAELLVVTDRLERELRPLSLDWYGEPGSDGGLAAVDLCHAVSGGPAALAGLVAAGRFGTPLLVTEYAVRLREQYARGGRYAPGATGEGGGREVRAHRPEATGGGIAPGSRGGTAPVRTLLAAYEHLLAQETYTRAQLITPGSAHGRRWQERCGADRQRLRTVYPGLDAAPLTAVREQRPDAEPEAPTLLWLGRISPAKDLVGLLHAFAEVRTVVPGARLRLVDTGVGEDSEQPVSGAAELDDVDYPEHCRRLAGRLFPGTPVAVEAACAGTAAPVSFETLGSTRLTERAAVYAAAQVVVLSSVVEDFPGALVEAMFAARATVSTDAGAVCEVIGGTGLVVPQREPRALADACVTLLRDPARRARLGAAARARALELFTTEANTAAFRGIYLELMSRCPVPRGRSEPAEDGTPQPFASPPESHVPGRWAGVRDLSGPVAADLGPARAESRASRGRRRGLGGDGTPSWARTFGVGSEPSRAARRRAGEAK